MNKTCNFCGNRNFRETRTQYIYRHDGKLLLVDDVPCEQCEYCGEQYFKAEVLKKIEQDFLDVYAHRRKAQAEITVPVEQFAWDARQPLTAAERTIHITETRKNQNRDLDHNLRARL